jgi:hypothetical protein
MSVHNFRINFLNINGTKDKLYNILNECKRKEIGPHQYKKPIECERILTKSWIQSSHKLTR